MKKIVCLFIILTSLLCCGCGNNSLAGKEPQFRDLTGICELAVMECYYHNVVKYKDPNVSGILWWQKDKHFWIEYAGVVKIGIDVSKVTMAMEGTDVTITIPEATVQGCKVDSATLTKDSYIVDKDSAKITAEDEIKAFAEAQDKLKDDAQKNVALLREAQNRAKDLMENYIKSVGDVTGKAYTVTWVYVDAEGNVI